MAALQLGELGLQGLAAVVEVRFGGDGGQGGGEQGLAVGAEDPFGEEAGDRVEEQVFADRQMGRVGGVPGLVGVVVFAGFAVVVDDAAFGAAPHAPLAQLAVQVGAQPVGAGGLGVAVGSGPGAGALPEPADGAGGFEDLPGDQRLVGGPGGPHPWLGGLIRPVTPRLARERLRRFHTM